MRHRLVHAYFDIDHDRVWDTVLKVITPPRLEELDTLLRGAHRAARRAGLKPANVRSAIARARAAR